MAALCERARKSGVSVSEYLRGVAREGRAELMDAGVTLGDILAAALLPTPDELAREAQQRLDARAQYKSALALARQLSPRLGVSEAECFDAMCTIPDNLLSLLCSPQGWTAIAGMVATDNGLADPGFMPALN